MRLFFFIALILFSSIIDAENWNTPSLEHVNVIIYRDGYNSKKTNEVFVSAVNSTVHGIEGKNNFNNPIFIEYNFLDFPFSQKSIRMSGVLGIFNNPSMSQSLNAVGSVSNLMRDGIYRIMHKSDRRKRFYLSAALLSDALLYLPMPLTSGWLHEEYHRSVLTKHGGSSYNEMNSFPIGKSLISVMHASDEDLIRLKSESPQDMTRLAAAGIEGEALLANKINREAFFYNKKSISFLPLMATLNSCIYVMMSSSRNVDKMIDEELMNEGSNISKRDILGIDFLSYTYDLFRPYESYVDRGIHPSGIGVNRYIKKAQLSNEELKYLKTQGFLQFINFLNPISFQFNSFDINFLDNDSDVRANLYLNHWLTSFGYDISATALLHFGKDNYTITFHNYANRYKWFPGIELETYKYLIGEQKIRNPFPVSARLMAWLQPYNELFFSKEAHIGGLFELKSYFPINKYLSSYFSIVAKTKGWVAGNVYQESNISCSFGLQAQF